MAKETPINYLELCIDLLVELKNSLANIEHAVKLRRRINGWHTDNEDHPNFPLDLKELLRRQKNLQTSVEILSEYRKKLMANSY